MAPNRGLLELGEVHNITQTSGADESRPVVALPQGHALYTSTTNDGITSDVHLT